MFLERNEIIYAHQRHFRVLPSFIRAALINSTPWMPSAGIDRVISSNLCSTLSIPAIVGGKDDLRQTITENYGTDENHLRASRWQYNPPYQSASPGNGINKRVYASLARTICQLFRHSNGGVETFPIFLCGSTYPDDGEPRWGILLLRRSPAPSAEVEEREAELRYWMVMRVEHVRWIHGAVGDFKACWQDWFRGHPIKDRVVSARVEDVLAWHRLILYIHGTLASTGILQVII